MNIAGKYIISQREAKTRGLLRYFTGNPCPSGHIEERHVSNYGCIACIRSATHAKAKTANGLAKERERYRRRDQDKENARLARYYYEHRDKRIVSTTRWEKKNPQVRQMIKKRHHARKRGATGSHTFEQIRALLVVQDHKCATPWCGIDISGGRHTEDHMMPLSRGGSDAIENIALLCHRCNCSKHTKTWAEWLAHGERINGTSMYSIFAYQ